MKKEMENREFCAPEDSNEIQAIPLHLELECRLSDEERQIFQKYGHTKLGFSRKILVPSDMPLHNLHYAIQKLFGWQNSHLHSFVLPMEEYMKLTGGMVKGWADLIGILFRVPDDGDVSAYYWDDDYQHGSIKAWFRTKYCGPYRDGAHLEQYEAAREAGCRQIESIVNRCNRVPYEYLTLEEMDRTIYIEPGTMDLLERLLIKDVLAPYSELLSPAIKILQTRKAKAITHELVYRYDYGDGWKIRIVRLETPEQIIKFSKTGDENVLNEAVRIVKTEHRPVCVDQDGMQLLDDVGGIHGFARMLKAIHEGIEEEADFYREWASQMGWNGRRVSNRLLL